MSKFPGAKLRRTVWDRYLSKIRWEHAILGALLLGVLLRLVHFSFGRMLWQDETMVAINLVARDGAELLQPLDFQQIAPTGWLFMEDIFVSIFRNYEYGARLPSLLAGGGALFLFYRISKEQFSQPTAFVSVFAFSVAFAPVYFSAELKPYAFDLLLWAAVAFIALKIKGSDKIPRNTLLLLALIFVLCSAFTFAVPTVVGGIGGVLILRALVRKDYRAAIIISISAMVSAAIYLGLSLSFYQRQVELGGLNAGGMGHYFERLYAPFPPTNLRELLWYPNFVDDTANALFGGKSALIYVFLSVCGLIACARKNLWVLGIIFAPIGMAFVLSALKLYPLMPRLMIYFIPICILLSAFALQSLLDNAPKLVAPIIAGALIFMNLGSFGFIAYEKMFSPRMGDKDISLELAAISQSIHPDDMIVITRWSLPNFLFYRHQYGLELNNWTIVDGAECLSTERLSIGGVSRVWLIKPFSAWRAPSVSSGRYQSAGNNVVMYEASDLLAELDALQQNANPTRPSEEVNCNRDWDVTPYLRGGVAPIS